MNSSANYADLIFFAVLAGVILYKLFTVLGRRGGGALPPSTSTDKSADTLPRPDNKPIPLKPAKQAAEATPEKAAKKASAVPPARKEPEPEIKDAAITAVMNEIKAKDASFTPGTFLGGAKLAFELALKALQDGDKAMLRNLLSAEVYKDFSAEMERRTAEGKFPQVTLVSIRGAEITSAEISRFKAVVAVEFTSEQIHVVKDAGGAIIEGNPSAIHEVTDSWSFERDMRSGNPNWTITAT